MEEATAFSTLDSKLAAAVRSGDEAAFTAIVTRYRYELHVHCYRMLGSYDDAEDVVQETFARAWRSRHSFQGWSTVRAWLYRIATNASLAFLDRHRRRPRTAAAANGGGAQAPDTAVPWLQPYPDRLLELAASGASEPDTVVVGKETIELAFVVAIQHLPPKQRAVLILRDVLGRPAAETAASLEMSVAADQKRATAGAGHTATSPAAPTRRLGAIGHANGGGGEAPAPLCRRP